ncbi:Arm DNA-binding domain-containing protein [Sneathiella aquimaris]|uniref:Arm DNA-binding domain-containing protein n=1 Tax=Sneathiella aquimaris TaxID=2599305 RepID=UPI00146BC24F
MGSVNSKAGKLFLDFRYRGKRCREFTKLIDTPAHRKRLQIIADRIDAEILLDQFDYKSYFPNSRRAEQLTDVRSTSFVETEGTFPLFSDFAKTWFAEMEPSWRQSYRKSQQLTLQKYLIPSFGSCSVDQITKSSILTFRADLTLEKGLKGNKLSPSRINHIMTPLRMILAEAAERYEFNTPFKNIKPLKVPRTDVEPFTLDEVWQIVYTVREDYKNYYLVRFFTALRTGEIDGLKWKYVDFDKRQILIREAIVDGLMGPVKTDGSWREVDMSAPVFEAFKRQYSATGKMEYVFCNLAGKPLRHNDVTKKVWYPLLSLLSLKKRRPYQTRHTAATLWLAAGESPEWIARQMGHSTTEMLFRVYSRFVPNLTRQDGSAFETYLQAKN